MKKFTTVKIYIGKIFVKKIVTVTAAVQALATLGDVTHSKLYFHWQSLLAKLPTALRHENAHLTYHVLLG